MDIHKPHAAKNWREFFIEIGTIVVGILIALGLEQAIETIHMQEKVAAAREAVRDEIQDSLNNSQQVLDMKGCVERELDALEKAISTNDRPTASAVLDNGSFTVQGLWSDAQWSMLASSQINDQLSPQERASYAEIYKLVRLNGELMVKILDTQSRLKVITVPGAPVTPEITNGRFQDAMALRSLVTAGQSNSTWTEIIAKNIGLAPKPLQDPRLPSVQGVRRCKAVANALAGTQRS